MTEKQKIILAKLYNRLSFYIMHLDVQDAKINITEDTSIKDLQNVLDNIYQDYRNRPKEEGKVWKKTIKAKEH